MYLLKKFLTVRHSESHIIIGGGSKTVYLELTNKNIALIELISTSGINLEAYRDSELVEKLQAANCLISKDDVRESYSRKELYFDYLGIDWDADKVDNFKIFVLGAGGGGSTLMYSYGQFGFKRLWCLDFDVVEETELEKTMVYRRGDIGKKKVVALKEAIQESFDTAITVYDEKVQNYSRLTEIIDEIKPDLIVNAIDPDPKHKLILNDICIRASIPVLFIAYSYESLILGPFIDSGKTSCYRSYNNFMKKGTQGVIDFEKIKRVKRINTIQPSISFNTNILASLALKETVLFMNNRIEFVMTYNSIIFYDVLVMEGESFELECNECLCQENLDNNE